MATSYNSALLIYICCLIVLRIKLILQYESIVNQVTFIVRDGGEENKSGPNQMKLYSILSLQEYQNPFNYPLVLMKSVIYQVWVS